MKQENPNVTKAIEAAKKKKRCRGYLFYGDGQGALECTPVPQFPGITTLLELFAVLEQCWSKETAYPSCQAEWVPNDPSYGQCAVTATLVFLIYSYSQGVTITVLASLLAPRLRRAMKT